MVSIFCYFTIMHELLTLLPVLKHENLQRRILIIR
jgi:spermidine synthase